MTNLKSNNKTATDANTALADSIISFETFKKIESYEQFNLQSNDASCFYGVVRIRKYKVTIEPIEEPKEILAERLQKLWDECNNSRHREPLITAAREIGYELKGSLGSLRKK